jgi:Flp pilus assembly protein TadG
MFPMGLRHLRADQRGAAAMEFGLVAPVLALFMMGVGDLLYGTYVNAILLGAIQEAGRDSTIEGAATTASSTAIDNKILTAIRRVAPNATLTSTRTNYTTFSEVNKPEPFVDKTSPSTNRAGVHDANECFSDTNGNGTYDAIGGRTGVGGANDVQQYKVVITYPRVFPIARFMGWSNNATIEAETVLKNQPYAGQTGVQTICPL